MISNGVYMRVLCCFLLISQFACITSCRDTNDQPTPTFSKLHPERYYVSNNLIENHEVSTWLDGALLTPKAVIGVGISIDKNLYEKFAQPISVEVEVYSNSILHFRKRSTVDSFIADEINPNRLMSVSEFYLIPENGEQLPAGYYNLKIIHKTDKFKLVREDRVKIIN